MSKGVGLTLARKIKVVLGGHDLSDVPDEMLLNVSKIIAHPDYSLTVHTSDIALVRLEKKVNFNKKVSPVCLTTNETEMNNRRSYFAAGWGDLVSGSQTGSNVLMFVQLPSYDFDMCNKQYKNRLDNKIQFCAGVEGKDTCQGDSGGPLMYRRQGRVYQAGITSFGGDVCAKNEKGVYTKVASFVKWIDENTKDASYEKQ